MSLTEKPALDPSSRSFRGRSRRVRHLALLGVLGVLVLLILPGFAAASPTPTLPAPVSSRPMPAGVASYCGMDGIFAVALTFGWNCTWPAQGPAPLNVTGNFTIKTPAGALTYALSWGDGAWTNGSLDVSTTSNLTIQVTHWFAAGGIYPLAANLTSSAGGSFGFGSDDLTVYGNAGLRPMTTAVNVTSGPVPLSVSFNATVAGAPANATTAWVLYEGGGRTLFHNATLGLAGRAVWNVSIDVPGTTAGTLTILDPAVGVPYTTGLLPPASVAPTEGLEVLNTVPTGPAPWNLTFCAYASHLNGSVYHGNGTVVWRFLPGFGMSVSGPTVGATIWQHITTSNYTTEGSMMVLARLVDWQGVTLAVNASGFEYANPPGPPPTTSLALAFTPSTGVAPFSFNLSAQLEGGPPSNAPSPYLLAVLVYPIGAGGTPWMGQVNGWNGSPVVLAGVLSSAGSYGVIADALEYPTVWNYAFEPVIAATNSLDVGPGPTSTPPPLAIGLSAGPTRGPGPLPETIVVSAQGGFAPYELSVESLGPAGGSAPVPWAALEGWNGLPFRVSRTLTDPGTYTVVATVTDALGVSREAGLSIVVNPTAGGGGSGVVVGSLAASISMAPVNVSSGEVTCVLQPVISGGVAPYSLSWNFGDGTSELTASDVSVAHTFAIPGSYPVTLKVTDSTGAVRTAYAGPVTLSAVAPTMDAPNSGAAPSLSWTPFIAMAGVVAAGFVSIRYQLRRL
jgi:PKD repeat protein